MSKKLLSALLILTASFTTLVACGASEDTASDSGSVYYLNFKPEVAELWNDIAEKYTAETGVPVKVVTAAGGEYESTLKSEMAKKGAPTLFHINGPMGYISWQDYCSDLSAVPFYDTLTDKSLAILGEDGGVYGLPLAIEGYGIIYNEAILDKYFALSNAKVKSLAEVTNFDTLKTLAEDIQANKDALGIEGAFAATSLLPGEDWRWQTHLLNMPIYGEFKDKGVNDLDVIEFTHSNEFKNIFDLYINNSTTTPTLLSAKGVMDSMAEFALGQAAMVQNGNWAWGQIADIPGNTVKAEDVKFLPIYTGLEGEENLGLPIGNENYLAINSQTSELNQQATIDFVNWLLTSETGKNEMVNTLGNIAPYSTFSDDEKPQDPLAQSLLTHMENGKPSVTWVFPMFPSQTFKNDVGASLMEYAQGTKTWADVESTVVDGWATQKALIK
ncbi:MAG: ABC transporter substrate-binding protein [Candidatus Epulonipiscioides saccharophilum]|nr:MAG: ABC transporter substrate-binding protein [Epulopiscium sp. AS2M-Bin001]